MSTTVFLTFRRNIPIEEWHRFCRHFDVEYSPHTIGQNTYYSHGRGVEVVLGAQGHLEHDANKRPFWHTARPPDAFRTLTVSTIYTSNKDLVADLASEIIVAFSARWSSFEIGDLVKALVIAKRGGDLEHYGSVFVHPEGLEGNGREVRLYS